MKQLWFHSRSWLKMALANFVLVALAGTALRYKVSFPFPMVNFENLLHAHSHFAFAGWVSTALFALIIYMFLPERLREGRSFRILFFLSQITSFGMLFSFFVEEYGPVSIGFSTAYIFVTYAFAFELWRKTRNERSNLAVKALRASLVFLCISSLGPYALAYMKAAQVLNGELYHNAIYWYLHFQYNGWFSFAVFALFLRSRQNAGRSTDAFQLPYKLMFIACAPVYLLSILWTVPPLWMYIVGGSGAILQIIALVMILKSLIAERRSGSETNDRVIRSLLTLSIVSFGIKVMLQFLSVFPALNQFVFGYRPVIIGYLHLVMLGFVSFFIIGIAISGKFLTIKSSLARLGAWLFIGGVILNETGLTGQGFAGILYERAPWTPTLLLCASIAMFSGLFLFLVGQFQARTSDVRAETMGYPIKY